MAKQNPNDRSTIQSLRLTISEALEIIGGHLQYGNPTSTLYVAEAMLRAAYDNTDPKLLDKDCGCG